MTATASRLHRRRQKDLAPKPEYVVSTGFNGVKARLAMLHGRRKLNAIPIRAGQTMRRAPNATGHVGRERRRDQAKDR
jgi:hypothetical protein